MTLPEKLQHSLSHMFDFHEDYQLADVVFPLYGRYYARSSRYFAVKKAELYAYSNFEHLFYYRQVGCLTEAAFEKLTTLLKDNVEKIVAPNDEHMSSVLTLIVECDTVTAELTKIIPKYKYKKSFKLGFYGWTELKVIVIVNGEGRAIENKAARGDAARLKLLSQF